MADKLYWADNYIERRCSVAQAIAMIKPGQRVFVGTSCGEPQHLVRQLAERAPYFTDVELIRLLGLETTPLTKIANKTQGQNFSIRSFYLGSGRPREVADHKRFLTPMNMSSIPRLFKSRRLPLDVALIQVSPPDDFGWLSLGISVNVTLAAAMSAGKVIAQVNPRMPRVLGRSFIHVNDVHAFVEHEEPILTVEPPPEMDSANTIGRLIARLIEDGSTIHISPGATPQATLLALSDKNDLGVHTEYLLDGLMHLYSRGVITNRRKGHKEGRMVAHSAMGSEALYEFLHDNPAVDFQPVEYVNDPAVIAKNNRLVTMSVPIAMDLTGQVAADAWSANHFSGVTGMTDFIRGAAQSVGGKSILMLTSTAAGGAKSRIVPSLDNMAVVVPRGDAHHVVTEYGAFNLFGKNLQERALGMISIAHPDFRDELFNQAKEMGLLGPEHSLREAIRGVYPVKLEAVYRLKDQEVVIRPAKPVDERRIQEHFYNLEKNDVISRFFHEKTSFAHNEIEGVSQIDYIKDLTMLAVVGEFGFGKVVGVGEYLLEQSSNLAEVAFSIDRDWQGQGLGKLLMRKLAQAARENGIIGLVAYTSPKNKGMIRLFKSLPYKTRTSFEGDLVSLTCRFSELQDS